MTSHTDGLASEFREGKVKAVDQEVSVSQAQTHRWLDAEDVPMQTTLPNQHAQLPHSLHHLLMHMPDERLQCDASCWFTLSLARAARLPDMSILDQWVQSVEPEVVDLKAGCMLEKTAGSHLIGPLMLGMKPPQAVLLLIREAL